MEMTQDEINKGNILIARFLGWNNPKEKPDEYGFSKVYYPDGSDMKFHSDWNWIKETIQAIHEIKDIDFETLYSHKVFQLMIHTSIEDTYKSIIEFLEWYNLNKQK